MMFFEDDNKDKHQKFTNQISSKSKIVDCNHQQMDCSGYKTTCQTRNYHHHDNDEMLMKCSGVDVHSSVQEEFSNEYINELITLLLAPPVSEKITNPSIRDDDRHHQNNAQLHEKHQFLPINFQKNAVTTKNENVYQIIQPIDEQDICNKVKIRTMQASNHSSFAAQHQTSMKNECTVN